MQDVLSFKWAGRAHWDSDFSPVRLFGLFMNGPNKEALQNTGNCQLLPDSNSLWAFTCCEGLLSLCMLTIPPPLSFPGQRAEIQCNSITCACGLDFFSPLCNFLLWKGSCKSKSSFQATVCYHLLLKQTKPCVNTGLGFPAPTDLMRGCCSTSYFNA